MKTIKQLSVWVIILILGMGCHTGCPDDEKIGDISLSAKSLAFFPYHGNQVLYFQDNTGNEIRFSSKEGGVQTGKDRVSVYKICTEIKYDGQSTYKYFESETKTLSLFSENPDFSMNFGIYTNTLRPEKELFYDKLIFDIMGTGQIGRGEIITDIRFSEAYEDSEFHIDSPVELLDAITLNGVTYNDVYATEDFDNARVYYNKTQGIVGFTTHDSKTYNLDRIEDIP